MRLLPYNVKPADTNAHGYILPVMQKIYAQVLQTQVKP